MLYTHSTMTVRYVSVIVMKYKMNPIICDFSQTLTKGTVSLSIVLNFDRTNTGQSVR